MITLHQTTVSDNDYKTLVDHLDADLKARDGDEHAFFAPHNILDESATVVVAYFDGIAAGIGALRAYNEGVGEIKRMYVAPEFRGMGIGAAILDGLENIALDRGYMRCILETSIRQPEAIRLYKKHGYHEISNYGPYVDVADSVSFEKVFVSG